MLTWEPTGEKYLSDPKRYSYEFRRMEYLISSEQAIKPQRRLRPYNQFHRVRCSFERVRPSKGRGPLLFGGVRRRIRMGEDHSTCLSLCRRQKDGTKMVN